MLISEVLGEHPERWTKGCIARKADGSECAANDAEACSWCLFGLVLRCYPLVEVLKVIGKLTEKLPKPFGDLGKFNDDPNTTFEDVLRLAIEVGV